MTCFNWMKKIAWRTLIIDEAHRIKNDETQISMALRFYQAEFKLLMTGTPLSNDLHEFKFPKMCGSGCTNPHAANYNPEISDDDGSCVTCASAGKCLPNDTDEGDNCNDVGNGCCDGYCETAGDCSPSFRQSFTAENGTYYPSCFG